jgi:nickel/cobalt transporter (NicO) family protein
MKRLLLVGLVAGLTVLIPAKPAGAHPLGNFSVNQYLGLTLHPDRLDATAIVDFAEIPTLQDRPAADTNHDGTVDPAELSARAASLCGQLSSNVDVRVGDGRLALPVTSSTFAFAPGAGGLDVSRLSCSLEAPTDLATDATLRVENRYLADRIGWREMTAVGDGVGLVDSPLPTKSVSNELRDYPQDLLSSVLDQRSATLTVTPGAGTGPAALGTSLNGGDPVSRWMSTVDRRFQDLVGGHLTPLVGLLAVLLAVLLGAGHAALPGHGKTIMAAYLAGKRGRPRDALTVAGTVTITHTAGVIVLGVLLTAGTALAGESILGWLGLVSGIVVFGVGATMLVGVIRRRGAPAEHHHGSHGHHHGPHGHHHGEHDHHHHHGPHRVRTRAMALVGSGHGAYPSLDELHVHEEPHAHPHLEEHDHAVATPGRAGRLGLAGIGIAGGLVPSPSALVVLLAAIGLGRTAFGILLVVAYGAGMAATLAGAGLLLVALQRRLSRLTTRTGATRVAGRVSAIAARVGAVTPAATASLVLIVGAGLAYRAAVAVL